MFGLPFGQQKCNRFSFDVKCASWCAFYIKTHHDVQREKFMIKEASAFFQPCHITQHSVTLYNEPKALPCYLYAPQRFLNSDPIYLRIKEAKTDTLFQAHTRKMPPYSSEQTTANAVCAQKNTNLYKNRFPNTKSGQFSFKKLFFFSLTWALTRFKFYWYN